MSSIPAGRKENSVSSNDIIIPPSGGTIYLLYNCLLLIDKTFSKVSKSGRQIMGFLNAGFIRIKPSSSQKKWSVIFKIYFELDACKEIVILNP